MFPVTDDIYEIRRQTYQYKGRLTVTVNRSVKAAATWEDVFQIFAGPERYEGEREEELENLESGGCCSYGGYMISRR